MLPIRYRWCTLRDKYSVSFWFYFSTFDFQVISISNFGHKVERGREIFNFFLLTYEENVNILQSIFSMFVSILSTRFRCSELVPPVMLFHWRPSYWNTHQGTAIPRWKHVLMSSSMNYGWVESACRMIKNYQNSSILQHKVRNLKIHFCWIFCFWSGKFSPWLLILNLILPGEPGNEAWCSWLRWPLGLELWEIREISGDLRKI